MYAPYSQYVMVFHCILDGKQPPPRRPIPIGTLDTGDLRGAMRRLTTAVAASCGVATAVALAVDQGPVADVSLLIALFLGVVTFGLAVAVAFDRIFDRPVHSPHAPAPAEAAAPRERCRSCSTRLVAVGPLLLCKVCDGPPR